MKKFLADLALFIVYCLIVLVIYDIIVFGGLRWKKYI
jgi:hypothetical protein